MKKKFLPVLLALCPAYSRRRQSVRQLYDWGGILSRAAATNRAQATPSILVGPLIINGQITLMAAGGAATAMSSYAEDGSSAMCFTLDFNNFTT